MKERFDFICYTGSTVVGKIIGEAANKHLTPCCLELGGKSPVYVDESADLETTAKRILWGKAVNVGQTCVAPDYILCSKTVERNLIAEFKKLMKTWYGEDAQKSEDQCRIITDKHFDRLVGMISSSSGKVAMGGKSDKSEKYIEMTVMTDVSVDDAIMKEEIFGPILPIVTCDSAQKAVDFINAREKPLTLYIYSTKKPVQDLLIGQTSSGSINVNDCLSQMMVDSLPFGGVGNSGYGAYHGDVRQSAIILYFVDVYPLKLPLFPRFQASFNTFTHFKSVFVRDLSWMGEKVGGCR